MLIPSCPQIDGTFLGTENRRGSSYRVTHKRWWKKHRRQTAGVNQTNTDMGISSPKSPQQSWGGLEGVAQWQSIYPACRTFWLPSPATKKDPILTGLTTKVNTSSFEDKIFCRSCYLCHPSLPVPEVELMIPDYLLEYNQVNGVMTWNLVYSNFLFLFHFLVIELRALGLLGKHPTTWTTLPAFLRWLILSPAQAGPQCSSICPCPHSWGDRCTPPRIVKPDQAKGSRDHILKKILHRKGLVDWLMV
jgi:hypothetical protein